MARKSLAQATSAAIPPSNGLRVGTVAATPAPNGQVAYVVINGAVCGPFTALGSYAPVAGDTVTLMRQDSSWLILGFTGASIANTWTVPTLLNGFTQRGTGFLRLQWRLIAGPELRMAGEIVSGATTTSGTVIFQLPSTVPWPLAAMPIPNTIGINAVGLLEVETNGQVKLFGTWIAGSIIVINGSVPLGVV